MKPAEPVAAALPRQTAGQLFTGLGAAGLLVVVAGSFALYDSTRLPGLCPGMTCTIAGGHTLDRIHSEGLVSTAAFIVGPSLLALGMFLWSPLAPATKSTVFRGGAVAF